VSLAQLEAFLAKHAVGPTSACAAAAVPELLEHVRAPRPLEPAPVEPTTWVHVWLKESGLEGLSDSFAEHHLTTRESLLAEPQLQLADLAAIGVKKAGDQRKVLALLKLLRFGSAELSLPW
jgi:hypothetical protein